MASTTKTLTWRPVSPGTVVSVPVEGGFVGQVTQLPGVEFRVGDGDPVFVPLNILQAAERDAIAALWR